MLKALATLFEAFTFFGGIIGGYFLFSGLVPGQTAIQTGASSATAVAFVAVPYCLAGIFHRAASRIAQSRLLDLYEE